MKNRMSMNGKIVLMSIGIAAVSIIVGVVGIVGMTSLNKQTNDMYTGNVLGINYCAQIQVAFEDMRISILNSVIAADAGELAVQETNFSLAHKRMDEGMQLYIPTIYTQKEKDLMAEIQSGLADYLKFAEEMFQYTEADNDEEARRLIDSTGRGLAGKLNAVITSLADLNTQLAKTTMEDAGRLFMSILLLSILIVCIGFVASIIIATVLSRSISRPVIESIRILTEGAAQLRINSEQMTISAGQLTASAGQLSSASQEIAAGASEQASSIEETTSSMEELASMVRQNMENAKEASILAAKSSDASVQGAGQMEKMLQSMQEIARSADEIQNVVDVIEDIAFQTNMLALNAAVEAARAGEAGMGFAVVADEVKNLANRSAENAKESGKMIKVAVARTQEGLASAQKLAELFKDILAGSRKVNEMTKEIESASRQQDEGITQVNKAIIQFDTVVQSNAANSEETASAAEETASTADQTASSAEELQSQVDMTNKVVQDLALIITGKAPEPVAVQYAQQRPAPVSRPKQALASPKGATKAIAHSRPAAAPGTTAQAPRDAAPGSASKRPGGISLDFQDDEEFIEK